MRSIYIYLLVLFLSFVAFAQEEKSEDYFNYERNYNELLKSYYITTNEKRLNETFPTSDNAYSSNGQASSVADAIYEQRLNSIPSAVNLVYNQQVRKHIIYYLDRMNKSVGVMLGLSKYYFPLFENILDSYGVPTELKYLVVIESAFNPTAVSKAGATGLWQFMYATGRIYDLRENSIVDDRCDPIKSTVAAAKYLGDLYDIYNDWSLVLAAYNCGPGNVNKAMKRSGKRDFWDIYTYLPRETRNYVPAFIAATYVMNFYDKHGIVPVELSQPLTLINDTVKVNKDVYFGQIADVLQMPVEQIKSLNPQYKMDYIPGTQANYMLKLPFDYIDRYIEFEDSIAHHNLEKYRGDVFAGSNGDSNVYAIKTIYHKVKRNETWNSIARKYSVTVSELRSWNRKIKRNRLRIGTMLTVKTKVLVEKEKIIDKDDNEKQSSFEQNEIVEANNMDNQPQKEEKKNLSTTSQNKNTNKNTTKTHVVKAGETLSSIARKYGTTEQKLRKINGFDNKAANRIRIGQKIKIK